MACIYPHGIGKFDCFHRPILISCGVCPNCRADKISLLESRAKEEWRKSEYCAFVRFSYDDQHLPYKYWKRMPDNSICPVGRPSVRRSDLSFIPRKIRDIFRYEDNRGRSLPKNCIRDFTWLGCNEYGETKNRPHLHYLFFGLDWAYIKPFLQKRVWPFGSVDVKPVKNGSIRYILNYLEQEPNGELSDSLYFDRGIEPPKVSWSKSFGRSFFENHIEQINQYGCVRAGNRFIPISTYYKNKYMTFTEERINRLFYESNRRRLANAERARFMGFRGSRPEVVKQYERFRSFNSAMERAVRSAVEGLNKISMSELGYLKDGFFSPYRNFDFNKLKVYHSRR